jgi:hypothetical protein
VENHVVERGRALGDGSRAPVAEKEQPKLVCFSSAGGTTSQLQLFGRRRSVAVGSRHQQQHQHQHQHQHQQLVVYCHQSEKSQARATGFSRRPSQQPSSERGCQGKERPETHCRSLLEATRLAPGLEEQCIEGMSGRQAFLAQTSDFCSIED